MNQDTQLASTSSCFQEAEIERLREENRHLRHQLGRGEKTEQLLAVTDQRVAQQTRELTSTREALEQQVRLVNIVLSSIVDFAYTINRAGCFTYINQALLDLWQLRSEEALGKNFFELPYPHELATRLHQQIATVFSTGQTLKDETSFINPAGRQGYYEYIFVPVFDATGQVEAIAGSTRDITARQQEKAEKEALLKTLAGERRRLIGLFMQAPAFIAVLRGPQHIFEMMNPLYDQLIGHRNALGKSVLEALPEVEEQGFITLLDDVYRTGKPFMGSNVRVCFQTGAEAPLKEHFVDFVYQPLLEADGSISGIFVHGVDLTEHRQAQAEIESLNVRLRRSVQETHHRVKNNLQVIGALAELQMEEGDTVPVAALVRIGQHTRALATIHDLLTQEAKANIEAEHISVRAAMDELVPLLRATAAGTLLITLSKISVYRCVKVLPWLCWFRNS